MMVLGYREPPAAARLDHESALEEAQPPAPPAG
jgi:hypothetical protein